jgi:hypothetical protein
MLFNNIPAELRALPQWLVWRYENDGGPKPTKVPYCPQTGELASVSNPQTWSKFDDAINANGTGGFNGIGFVFTSSDPYAFIDLDDAAGNTADLERQQRIYREFNSYSEVSPSGKGLHVIVKGAIPSGRRRAHIEIYSELRYATFTGNVHSNNPIAERNELLNLLWQQMGGGQAIMAFDGDPEQKFSDDQILSKAREAANGEKFKTLERGAWNELYQSQSEADFAYVDMIAFYTQNREQITRIFRNSPLGQRKKAARADYINYMLNRCFDRMLPPIDLDISRNALDEVLAKKRANGAVVVNGAPALEQIEMFRPPSLERPGPPVEKIPPGLMGDIARFIYDASPRPVPEIAIAGAIGLMAGIAGRAYNISATGLNMYVLMIAATGTGKEAMKSGIDRLLQSVKVSVPSAIDFMGPAHIASSPALIKHLSRSPCFITVLGEFGLRLQAMSTHTATASDILLRSTLLDLYNKSGNGRVLEKSIYSDKEKNTEAVMAPAFSILGESTPGPFFENLDEDMISQGLLPRFMVMEYKGPAPYLSVHHEKAQPSFALIEQLSQFSAYCLSLMQQQKCLNVQTDEGAKKIFDDYSRYTTDQTNSSTRDVVRHLWSRAHIKLLKLSALIAAGINPHNPVIETDVARWALELVDYDIRAMSAKFTEGGIGKLPEEVKQQRAIKRVINEYLTSEHNPGYATPRKLHDERIIPYAYVSRRLITNPAFVKDRRGATEAIKKTMQHFAETGELAEIPTNELVVRYGIRMKSFTVIQASFLDVS